MPSSNDMDVQMLAILLSSKMDPFYSIIGSFPTAIWTFFLGIFLFYWIVAVLGFVSIDLIDMDVEPGQSTQGMNALVGLFLRFGLIGVPLTISLTIVSTIGWFLSFFSIYFMPESIRGTFLIWPVGLVVLCMTGFIALWATGYIVKPLVRFFQNTRANSRHTFVGTQARVRTSRVDALFGEAEIVDGGAGLLVQVRCFDDNTLTIGDAVVILEYDQEKHFYRVSALD